MYADRLIALSVSWASLACFGVAALNRVIARISRKRKRDKAEQNLWMDRSLIWLCAATFFGLMVAFIVVGKGGYLEP